MSALTVRVQPGRPAVRSADERSVAHRVGHRVAHRAGRPPAPGAWLDP
ncbi:hypothetical protein ACFSM7_14660 [Clavibacter michiganensis subsp. tessellarius]